MNLKRNTSPEDAQRTVTRFVILEIGDRLYGGDPEEIKDQSGRDCWSVPVFLVLPDNKRRKEVGKILVDAATGKMQVTEGTVTTLTAKAKSLASQPATRTHHTGAS